MSSLNITSPLLFVEVMNAVSVSVLHCLTALLAHAMSLEKWMVVGKNVSVSECFSLSGSNCFCFSFCFSCSCSLSFSSVSFMLIAK